VARRLRGQRDAERTAQADLGPCSVHNFTSSPERQSSLERNAQASLEFRLPPAGRAVRGDQGDDAVQDPRADHLGRADGVDDDQATALPKAAGRVEGGVARFRYRSSASA
jgi:hypothetical protein